MKVYNTTTLITENRDFKRILSYLDPVINTDSAILITGETGTGKEILADYIHRNSNRNNKPFIKVGLSSIPAELLESELFGYEKGAFTGATNEKKGLFELANEGSIFLDDIDDFPVCLQSKLLRVLESGELMRIGSEKPVFIDVRLITASKVNLKNLVDAGKFRADLYYRINVVPVNIPPLREHADDIPLLIDYFIQRYAGDRYITVSPEAMETLKSYVWPGNVRELKNVVKRLVLFCRSQITNEDLPKEIFEFNYKNEIINSCVKSLISRKISFREVVNCLEANLIKQTLEKFNGNKLAAAKFLSLPASTLNDKIKKYKLDIGKYICVNNHNNHEDLHEYVHEYFDK